MKNKPDYTVGMRGGTFYAFTNNERARKRGSMHADTLDGILSALENSGYSFDYEADIVHLPR